MLQSASSAYSIFAFAAQTLDLWKSLYSITNAVDFYSGKDIIRHFCELKRSLSLSLCGRPTIIPSYFDNGKRTEKVIYCQSGLAPSSPNNHGIMERCIATDPASSCGYPNKKADLFLDLTDSKEEYKPYKWGATASYYASHTKAKLPTRKSVPRSSRQSDHTKTSWPW